ncbi:MAG TPA: SRPBCC family protein [Nocardioidaceae bacterium]|nr:SRPBCC family protein [Nocardioidaceae bacterium]
MPQVKMSENIASAPADVWALVSNLSRLGEWLSLHEAWRGEVPELAEGVQLTGVVSAKGMRNKVTWVVDHYDPPRHISLTGDGVGGTKVSLDMRVTPAGTGSTFDFAVDFSHPALKGPLGSIAGKTIKSDLSKALEKFNALL